MALQQMSFDKENGAPDLRMDRGPARRVARMSFTAARAVQR
jgi:hypothetical protein